MSILITGAAGFIGFHLCKKLLERDENVIAIDNISSYYDKNLKEARIKILEENSALNKVEFKLIRASITNKEIVEDIFKKYKPKIVFNLAAQAGVRYSLENPYEYIQTNLVGFSNILEGCRNHEVEHLIYASSSSVYGGNTNIPFSEQNSVDHPVSLYAATKKSNELIAHSYSHLYDIPSTGLRFFTVYGPWGRPDMALFIFTKSILEGKPIKVFNQGEMIRDFTYIEDIIESLLRIMIKPAKKDELFDSKNPNPASSWAPHRVFNIGNSTPTPLIEFIEALEDELGIKSKKILLPIQPGDVPVTAADTTLLQAWTEFRPNTPIKEGIKKFVYWYKDYYGIK
tara:strand:- start:212 stop:1237 length:1026 start_codon:yes stop_codon:yes gene_type:complete